MNEPRTDAEVSLKSVLGFAIGLAVVATVLLALFFWMIAHWKKVDVARDPRPSPMAEANAPRQPPEPRLQADPDLDMRTQRAHEQAVLATYGWVDQSGGWARIPIERAMDLVAQNGFPPASPMPAGAEAAPAGSPSGGAAGGAQVSPRTPKLATQPHRRAPAHPRPHKTPAPGGGMS